MKTGENLDRILRPRPFWKKAWVWMVALLLIGTGGVLYYLFAPSHEKPASYMTQPLKKGALEVTVSATGYLLPLERVKVGSEVSGTITKVFVDFNDRVQKGEVLAQIDRTKFQSNLDRMEAALAAAKAQMAQAQAQLQLAQKNFARDRKLRKTSGGRLPSPKQYDRDRVAWLSAKAALAGAKAQVEQAKFAVDTARYDLNRTTIRSPIDGIVLKRLIDPGQTVAATFQTPELFRLANDLSKMELKVSIDEADIAHIHEGEQARFSVDAYPEREFNATVKSVRIDSQIVAGVVTYDAILSVDNSDNTLRPGMSADVKIITKKVEGAWIVPRAAMLYEPVKVQKKVAFGPRNTQKAAFDPRPHVWVLHEDKPKKIYVEVLGTSGSDAAVSAKALHAGDRVILAQEQEQT